MTAAEVYPLHTRKKFPEFLLKGPKRSAQSVGVLFAKGVEVQPADAIKQVGAKILASHAKAGIAATRVVKINLNLGILGVDPNSTGNRARVFIYRPAKMSPLAERVKNQVIGIADNLSKVRIPVGRTINMNLTPKLFSGQSGLIQRTGAGPRQHRPNLGKKPPHGKALEGQNDFRPATPLHRIQRRQIGGQFAGITNITGRWHLLDKGKFR